MESFLTVFTPTYNRSHTLPRLYESLCQQTRKDFIWIVVDDGSTDHTAALVNTWIKEERCNIQYYFQTNRGKQFAHNRGVELATTELFVCVDSDDYLTPNAVGNIGSKWERCSDTKHVCGILSLRGYPDGSLNGSGFPQGVETTSIYDLYTKHGFSGDTMLVFTLNILRQFPFPEIPGERFINEAIVYNRISKQYTMAILDQILYVGQYLPDGYTHNIVEIMRQNPRGFSLYYKELVLMEKSLLRKWKYAAQYIAFAVHGEEQHMIKNSAFPLLSLLLFPLGLWYYRKKLKSV
ncbi:glycosyltransferase family 2 protein [Paenibacillus hexagrammi]|uniref:Glycosyltransferase family 2 protein n=1 Tax=Paenibacillus hexagrammi TaxID=2908839 RepID=A0ABY3SHE6_9BACL|nr:glycosyltransferase family 2 protein [Paenibacillus sp. YPD9-1]UJF32790.1 glycosyltransferase family 2 protein [Paenibacillus sp. YPD9-1]